MKVALSGAGGTGKTFLSEIISKRFNIPMIPEFARETAEEMGIKNLREMSPKEAYDFQSRILERKIAEENKHDSFIADRSTADNLAYYLRWCSRNIDDSENMVYVEMCINRLKMYDVVIVLPWQKIPLENDGFRSMKIYYQYEIHCLVMGILKDHSISTAIMNHTNMEERIKFMGRYFR